MPEQHHKLFQLPLVSQFCLCRLQSGANASSDAADLDAARADLCDRLSQIARDIDRDEAQPFTGDPFDPATMEAWVKATLDARSRQLARLATSVIRPRFDDLRKDLAAGDSAMVQTSVDALAKLLRSEAGIEL
jgi:hypothetical protein